MQRIRENARVCAWACAAGAVLLATIVGWPRLVLAFNPQPEPPAFGMVGLARFQTARLNLVHVHPDDAPPEGGILPCTCEARLSFLDGAGQPFVDRAGMSVGADVRLDPDQAAFVDLRSADVFRNSDALRAQFRATLDFVDHPDVDAPSPCVHAVATLDVFDNFTGARRCCTTRRRMTGKGRQTTMRRRRGSP